MKEKTSKKRIPRPDEQSVGVEIVNIFTKSQEQLTKNLLLQLGIIKIDQNGIVDTSLEESGKKLYRLYTFQNCYSIQKC